MGMFTFQDLILFGTFLIALLAYIDRDDRHIQQNPSYGFCCQE